MENDRVTVTVYEMGPPLRFRVKGRAAWIRTMRINLPPILVTASRAQVTAHDLGITLDQKNVTLMRGDQLHLTIPVDLGPARLPREKLTELMGRVAGDLHGLYLAAVAICQAEPRAVEAGEPEGLRTEEEAVDWEEEAVDWEEEGRPDG